MNKLKALRLKQVSEALEEKRPIVVEKIGQRLRDIREVLGMTQKQLAKRIKISQPLLSRIEDNSVSCSLMTIVRIARALECDFLGVLVPKDSLETVIRKQAENKARSMLNRTFANMAMEKQSPGNKVYADQFNKLVEELTANSKPELWDD